VPKDYIFGRGLGKGIKANGKNAPCWSKAGDSSRFDPVDPLRGADEGKQSLESKEEKMQCKAFRLHCY
jgi:hypothetical protein